MADALPHLMRALPLAAFVMDPFSCTSSADPCSAAVHQGPDHLLLCQRAQVSQKQSPGRQSSGACPKGDLVSTVSEQPLNTGRCKLAPGTLVCLTQGAGHAFACFQQGAAVGWWVWQDALLGQWNCSADLCLTISGHHLHAPCTLGCHHQCFGIQARCTTQLRAGMATDTQFLQAWYQAQPQALVLPRSGLHIITEPAPVVCLQVHEVKTRRPHCAYLGSKVGLQLCKQPLEGSARALLGVYR